MNDVGNHMLNLPYILALIATLGLTACASDKQTKPVDAAVSGLPGHAASDVAAREESAEDKKLDARLTALEATIKAPTFETSPSQYQYRALSTAGVLAISRDKPKLGYTYLVRAVAMPDADFDIRLAQTFTAGRLGYVADAVNGLTVMARQWPDQLSSVEGGELFIADVLDQAGKVPRSARLTLLESLHDGRWTPKLGNARTAIWRDLTMLLLEAERRSEAIEVSLQVTDVYTLIAMRSDRRFDAVIAANPAHFDIDNAADQELRGLQAAADATPQSLELQRRVVVALLSRQRYEAALAAADSAFAAIKSTNYPRKLYEDYEQRSSAFLDARAVALERMGRWDEAVAELTVAGGGGNVNQLINLGSLYCEMGRPHEALSVISTVDARTSHYGTMQEESVRLDAAEQLGNSRDVERSLQYLRVHRADAPSAYLGALIVVSRLDKAAHELIAQLTDVDQRQDALQSVQEYGEVPGTAWDGELNARWRKVVDRKDVQAVIHRVGRVESYHLELP
jgi:tetratricopeptide (TPR) repeat protein